MASVDKVITLVYFDREMNEAHVHTTIPESILHKDALYIAENGVVYNIAYYNDVCKVAFAISE